MQIVEGFGLLILFQISHLILDVIRFSIRTDQKN